MNTPNETGSGIASSDQPDVRRRTLLKLTGARIAAG